MLSLDLGWWFLVRWVLVVGGNVSRAVLKDGVTIRSPKCTSPQRREDAELRRENTKYIRCREFRPGIEAETEMACARIVAA